MTQEEYKAGLAWLELKNPSHPLMRQLRLGFTKINVLYMRQALKTVAPAEEVEAEEEETNVSATDPKLIKMQRERRTLFTHRAKLSNQFHECSTDSERAAISDSIQRVQRQIGECLRNIRQYRKTGKLPEVAKAVDEIERLTGVQLMKKRESTKGSIRYLKKMLEQSMYERGDDIKAKREKWEAQLKQKQHDLIRIERQVAKESV